MRSTINRFLTFLSAFAVSFFALTPVSFAVENPNTGDNNMVPVVIGLLAVSAIVIVLLLVISAAKKKKR